MPVRAQSLRLQMGVMQMDTTKPKAGIPIGVQFAYT